MALPREDRGARDSDRLREGQLARSAEVLELRDAEASEAEAALAALRRGLQESGHRAGHTLPAEDGDRRAGDAEANTTEGFLMNKVLIHLVGGQVIEAYDDVIESTSDLEQLVSEPPKPHWVRIGDALVFTQAIAGLELG